MAIEDLLPHEYRRFSCHLQPELLASRQGLSRTFPRRIGPNTSRFSTDHNEITLLEDDSLHTDTKLQKATTGIIF